MSYSVCVRATWCAAHRLLNYKGSCNYIHGHNYVLEIIVDSSNLDSLDMVIDFKIIKNTVKDWLDKNWDHSIILNKEDKDVIEFVQKNNFKFYLMEKNPTAEAMAKYLYNIFIQYFVNYKIKVRVYETEHNFAEYSE